jgi:hypothetical protein
VGLVRRAAIFRCPYDVANVLSSDGGDWPIRPGSDELAANFSLYLFALSLATYLFLDEIFGNCFECVLQPN